MAEKSRVGKILTGTVVSTAMTGVIVVDIERKKTHRIYGKSYTVNRRIKAVSTGVEAVGDIVTIVETKPSSKNVSFKVKS